MNIRESDILRTLLREPFVNQRMLAEEAGCSLGVVNRSLRSLTEEGYLSAETQPTEKARAEIREKKPRNAIILAAGFGMRMVPINLSTPKALLEVNGERLIDRLIKQLKAVGVDDITVVVGFMKDSFEYLMDEYGVDLVVNEAYAVRNNLHSLAMVADRIRNTYIVPCDIWSESDPFDTKELYSWYMVSDQLEEDSPVRVNRKMELVAAPEERPGNAVIGIAYLLEPEAAVVRRRLKELDDEKHTDDFWEKALYRKDRMIVRARMVSRADIVEINTYEQLRDLDSASNQLRSNAIRTIADVLACREDEITDIQVLKKGMTNRSFLFCAKGEKYIMRIPGEGTDQIIDREQEAAVFRAISGRGLCDDPVYIDPHNGYKITKFLEGVRVCDADDVDQLSACMKLLSDFHRMDIRVEHTFDIFGKIEFYESLWDGARSVYRDYAATKAQVFSLRDYVERTRDRWCLTHIDAVPDNFLFYDAPEGEALQLTDWEYAGMQDPHVDVAMFCIYSLYDKSQVDRLIRIYFEQAGERCTDAVRAKIYCYIAACGLLWSNWCEFKSHLGVEFGEYSLRQYRYAKDYYKYAMELMEK